MQTIETHKGILFSAIESWLENQEELRKEQGNNFPITLPEVTSNLKAWIESDFHLFLETYAFNLEQFEDYAFNLKTFTTEFSQSVFLSLIENLSLSDIHIESVEDVINEHLSISNDWLENSYLNQREMLEGSELAEFDTAYDKFSKIDLLTKKLACAVLDNESALITIFKKQLSKAISK
jgi:hypothetical protein